MIYSLKYARKQGLVALAALLTAVALAYAAKTTSHNALLQVVRLCAFDQATFGQPLPCLKLVPGPRGYAILRPPFGRPDTILTPIVPIVGLEDPKLQDPDVPNYFALAWKERAWISPQAPSKPLAFAVNSRIARSQNQLHIHMGCLAADFAVQLENGGLGSKMNIWLQGPDLAPGLQFWSYRKHGTDWGNLQPFPLLKTLLGDEHSIAHTTLGVIAYKGDFVIIALVSQNKAWHAHAEDIVDARCL